MQQLQLHASLLYLCINILLGEHSLGTYLRKKIQERRQNVEPIKTFNGEQAWAVMVDRDYSVQEYKYLQRDVNTAAKKKVYPGKNCKGPSFHKYLQI